MPISDLSKKALPGAQPSATSDHAGTRMGGGVATAVEVVEVPRGARWVRVRTDGFDQPGDPWREAWVDWMMGRS